MTEEPIYCSGCGIQIQTDDETAAGFVPRAALNHEPVLCRRCFRLKHYNEVQDVSMTADDFLKLLSQIANADALVVYLVDIFDLTGSWISGLQRFVGDNPVLLVGNKEDLLPKSTNPNKLKSWIRRSASDFGLRPVDVLLMSAEKNHGIDDVRQNIEYYREGRDVYVVGATNVGKSTFINHLIENAGEEAVITTSRFPGTTLDFIGIPLDDGSTLYDTPGIMNQAQAAHFVDPQDYKKIMPTKEIKPKVYQLNERQTLFLGGLGRIDYAGPGRRSLIVYTAGGLVIHRTKMENAASFYERQYGRLLTPPSHPVQLPVLKRYDFRTDALSSDVVFSGLGWVTVKGRGARISAWAPESIGVSLRTSVIKG
ncbi:ribosome biogenesis GTPase YqeH [Sporolactobacillus spathodeae]|uniref:Ribosome biogenesis GTPase YqeH n=1 Tax=Sporolactobacillus spathodeae TaxID=1465502 RepID=A0ABS2Q6I0_9BACL|nr:ribosome biogenesis GTPase YqeH [Sporolactobacillus spathodeae]MBM7657370.1 ribosome biogenesis GTPase YqeH [Sporolactobacillus spathodeae]